MPTGAGKPSPSGRGWRVAPGEGPSCRCPGVPLHVSRTEIRSFFFVGGGGDPLLPMPAVRDEERVADAVHPLCPPCSLWFNPGGTWGVTTEAAEDTEGLRMIPAAPRLARRDPDFVFGGWRGPPPGDARSPRRGACRGCRPPSVSSVFSVVQSGVTWGVTTEAAEDTEGLRMIPAVPRLARRDPDFVFGGWRGPPPEDARSPRRGACRGCRPPSVSSVFSVVQSGGDVGGHHRGRGGHGGSPHDSRSSTPRASRSGLCLGGVAGPLSCRYPGVRDRVGREEITTENTEVTEGLRMIPAVPRLARRDPDFVFGGWKGPHPADARQSETRSVSRMPSTLCVLCVLCG